jgi:hypothetical protein
MEMEAASVVIGRVSSRRERICRRAVQYLFSALVHEDKVLRIKTEAGSWIRWRDEKGNFRRKFRRTRTYEILPEKLTPRESYQQWVDAGKPRPDKPFETSAKKIEPGGPAKQPIPAAGREHQPKTLAAPQSKRTRRDCRKVLELQSKLLGFGWTRTQSEAAAGAHRGDPTDTEWLQSSIARYLAEDIASLESIGPAQHAATRLRGLHDRILREMPPLVEVEEELTDLEGLLLRDLERATDNDLLAKISDDARRQVQPYRARMPSAQIEQLVRQAGQKSLLAHWKAPQLSLFYMQLDNVGQDHPPTDPEMFARNARAAFEEACKLYQFTVKSVLDGIGFWEMKLLYPFEWTESDEKGGP